MNQGTIQTIEDKTTKDNKPYRRVQIDNYWYTLFDNNTTLNPGDQVNYEHTQKGDFKNVTKIEVTKKEEGTPKPHPAHTALLFKLAIQDMAARNIHTTSPYFIEETKRTVAAMNEAYQNTEEN